MSDDEGIRQLARNKFQVRVKRVNVRTGKQKNRKATVFGSKADARRKRDDLRNELASQSPTPRKVSLKLFALSWLEQRVAAGLKNSTIRRYRYCFTHILPALGDLFVGTLTPADISAYIAERIKSKAEGHTVLNELRCLRTMAKDSIVAGCATIDWCMRVKAPKVRRYTKKRSNLLNGEQFAAVILRIPTQWRGLVLFIATTGLRWGETSALHWEDVNTRTGARALLAVLPVVRAAEALQRNRESGGRTWTDDVCDAVNAMRAALDGKS